MVVVIFVEKKITVRKSRMFYVATEQLPQYSEGKKKNCRIGYLIRFYLIVK